MNNPGMDYEDAEDDAPYDAADSKNVNDARKRAARIRQKRINFMRTMMGSQEGRLWLYDLLDSCCCIFGNPFVPGMTDATCFNVGKQDVGKRILAEINEAAPDKYARMLTEGRLEK